MRLLEVEDLTVVYATRTGRFAAIRNVGFHVDRGEILGIVGESGAGKSTIGSAIMRLIDYPGLVESGRVRLSGDDVLALDDEAMRRVRGTRIAMIFQDPLTALNPVLTIGLQLKETIRLHLDLDEAAVRARAIDLLRQVGIPEPESRLGQYPHQFSGGMRQRVVIAIALAGEPELLVADEPTTALDVSIQSEILALIRDLCRKRELGVILVTHDMAVINEVTDRVAVMLHGRMIEVDSTRAIVDRPRHPYTRSLIAAVPRTDVRLDRFEMVSAAEYADFESDAGAMQRDIPWFRAAKRREGEAGTVLRVEDLTVEFVKTKGLIKRFDTRFRAVDRVSFDIRRGETFGIVGESGSGKSTVARMIVGLETPLEGRIEYDGRDITRLSRDADLRRQCVDMQIIFQDPFSSLNPRMRVLDILTEPILYHGMARRDEARQVAHDVLARVGLDEAAAAKFPHQFSGGQRQRLCIARALMMRPRFLVCDEPTSALDVSIQASLLNLLKDLQEELGLTMMFISHDLAVIRQMCDRVAVMRHGMICEVAQTEMLFAGPRHEYTRELLRLMPKFGREIDVSRQVGAEV